MSRRDRPVGATPNEVTQTVPETAPPDPQSPRAPLVDVIERGPYLVSGEIGRGGLGQVLEAGDKGLERPVARSTTPSPVTTAARSTAPVVSPASARSSERRRTCRPSRRAATRWTSAP